MKIFGVFTVRWAISDGTRYERRYLSLSTYEVPSEYNPNSNPSAWSSTLTQISTTKRYRHVTERTSQDGGKTWGQWCTPQLDAYLAEDGRSFAINGSAKGVIGYSESLPANPESGTQYLDNRAGTSDIEKYENGAWSGVSASLNDAYLVEGYLWVKARAASTSASVLRWENQGYIKGDKGDDGDDAYSVILEPANLIFTQSTTKVNDSYPLNEATKTATVTVKKGSSNDAVPHTTTVVGYTHCASATASGDTITVTGQVDGNTEGSVDIRVAITDGPTFNLKLNLSYHLLGVWKESVDADTKTEIASRIIYVLGASGETIETIKADYQNRRNALVGLEQWRTQKEAVYNNYSTQITNTNQRISNAEESIQELTENIRTTVYDISQMSNDEWVYGNASSTSGKTYIENANTLGNGKRVRTVMLLPFSQTMKYDLLAGWSVQFFFYDAEGLSTGYSTNRIIADSDIEGSLVGLGSASFNASSYFAVVMGKSDNSVIDDISDIAQSGFVVYDEENSSSVYQQTATLIRQEVAGTGIDITKGQINIKAGHVNFVDPNGDSYSTPKIRIDATDGTLHAVDGVFEGVVRAGLLYKHVKRIRPNVFEDGNLRTGCSYGTNTAGVPYYTYSAEALIEDCDGIMPAILIFYSNDVETGSGADFIRSAEAGGYRMDVELPPAADWQGLEVLVCVQGRIKQSSNYYPNIVVNSYNDEGFDTLFMFNLENSIQYFMTADAYVEKGTYSTITMYSVRLVSAYGNYGWKWTILENTENVRYNTWATN